MRKLLVLFVVLFALVFTYTTIAQEMGSLRKGYEVSFPEKIQSPLGLPLAAGTYSVGTGGYFPTIDSAFKKLSADGVAGAVNLTLIDTLYEALNGHQFLLNGPVTGAGPSARITIRPAAGKYVTVRGDSDAVFLFHNVKYLSLDGRSNPPSPSSGIFIHALYNPRINWTDCVDSWGDSDFNEFLYLKLRADDPRAMTGIVSDCIGLFNEGANTPDNNLVEGNFTSGTIGIYIGGTAANRPSNNIIRKNSVGNVSDILGVRGITSEFANGSLIEGNTVQFQRRWAFPDYTLGINAYANLNTIIRNNVVHSLSGLSGAKVIGILGSGGSAGAGQGLQIYNNMIYNLQNTSTTGNGYVGGIDLWWNTDVLIAYNTVLLSGTGTNLIGTYALGYDVQVYNCTIRNNILVNLYHQTNGSHSTALWIYGIGTFTSDYNDLYVDTTFANSYAVIHNNVGNYRTLTNWQATGRDIHSITEMPNFIAPDNLHINTLIATYIESGGTPIAGVTSDFDGDLRNTSKPDIGADEINGIVLPVELTSFTAEALNQKVVLKWSTATELNNNGFEVQRKVTESEFATIGFVRGEGTTTNQREYSYIDKDLVDGKYYYRLKQIDFNGSYEYSNVIEVDVRTLDEFTLEQNYPNPFNPTTTIGYVLREKTTAKLVLLNAIGEEIGVLLNEEQEKGFHKVDFSAVNLSSGIYFYRLQAGDYTSVKKMLLLK